MDKLKEENKNLKEEKEEIVECLRKNVMARQMEQTCILDLKEENKKLKEQIEKLQKNLKKSNKVIDQIEKVILISNKEWRVGLADADDE